MPTIANLHHGRPHDVPSDAFSPHEPGAVVSGSVRLRIRTATRRHELTRAGTRRGPKRSARARATGRAADNPAQPEHPCSNAAAHDRRSAATGDEPIPRRHHRPCRSPRRRASNQRDDRASEHSKVGERPRNGNRRTDADERGPESALKPQPAGSSSEAYRSGRRGIGASPGAFSRVSAPVVRNRHPTDPVIEPRGTCVLRGLLVSLRAQSGALTGR